MHNPGSGKTDVRFGSLSLLGGNFCSCDYPFVSGLPTQGLDYTASVTSGGLTIIKVVGVNIGRYLDSLRVR